LDSPVAGGLLAFHAKKNPLGSALLGKFLTDKEIDTLARLPKRILSSLEA